MASKRGYGIINGITKKFYKHYIVMNSQTKRIKKAYEVANGITIPCWSADRILGIKNVGNVYSLYEMETPVDAGTLLGVLPGSVSQIVKWNKKYWVVSDGNLYFSSELDSWTQFTNSLIPIGSLLGVFNGGQHLVVYGRGFISLYDRDEGFACIIDTDNAVRRTIFQYSSDMTTWVYNVVTNSDGSYAIIKFESSHRTELRFQIHLGYYSSSGDGSINFGLTGTEYDYEKGTYGNNTFVLTDDHEDDGSIRYGQTYRNLTRKSIYYSRFSVLGFFKGYFYLMANNGIVLYSNNPSENWSQISTWPDVSRVLICGNIMYGFNGTTVYQTTDGQSWENVGTSSYSSNRLYFDEA